MRWLTIAVAVFTLVLVGAGCGGGDDEASGTDTTVITDTLDTDETTTDETTTDDDSGTDTGDLPTFASEDCQSLVAAFVVLSAATGAAASGTDISEDVEKFAELAEGVPDEIKDDVATVAEAYSGYASLLADVGLQPGEIPTAAQAQELQEAAQALASEDVSAAGERLSAWTTENC